MKKLLLLLPMIFFFYGCSKDDYDLPKCKFDNAAQDLVWLKAIIDDREASPTEDMKYCYIEQAKLNRKTVFIFMDCNPLVNKAIFVIDCEGNPILKDDGSRELTAPEVTLKKRKIIWRPKDFACNL